MGTETTYTVRVNPEGNTYYSYAVAKAVDVDFATALQAARRQSESDSWHITRSTDGAIVAQHDAYGINARLWRNYRRDELAAQRQVEFLQRLEPKIRAAERQLWRDTRDARAAIDKALRLYPADHVWRTMKHNRLMNAIAEAVLS